MKWNSCFQMFAVMMVKLYSCTSWFLIFVHICNKCFRSSNKFRKRSFKWNYLTDMQTKAGRVKALYSRSSGWIRIWTFIHVQDKFFNFSVFHMLVFCADEKHHTRFSWKVCNYQWRHTRASQAGFFFFSPIKKKRLFHTLTNKLKPTS